jgi:3-oxoadipate enol-lactonase
VSHAGSGPLVLFLHGIRGNRRDWARQVALFSQRYLAVAVDARGFGESDDYDGWLVFDDLIGDVLRVARHFKAERMHIVGLAMGGRIGRHVALRHPERVASLTLVSTNPGFDALSANEVRRFVTERANRTPEILARLIGSQARPGTLEEVQASVGRLREQSYLKMLEASVLQDRATPLESLRVPTLVVAGDEDFVLPPEMTRAMAARIPGAELMLMQGIGHFPPLEQPERFNAAVIDFITRKEKQS